MDERTSVRLIEALSRVWTKIRIRHPDVPPVVLLAAPAPRGEMRVLGHFAALRWSGRWTREVFPELGRRFWPPMLPKSTTPV